MDWLRHCDIDRPAIDVNVDSPYIDHWSHNFQLTTHLNIQYISLCLQVRNDRPTYNKTDQLCGSSVVLDTDNLNDRVQEGNY